MASFNITFDDEQQFNIGFSNGGGEIPASFDSVISAPSYTGDYDFTPSEQTQVISGKGLVLTDNIAIQPIPTNYGKLTWNGSVLTVS